MLTDSARVIFIHKFMDQTSLGWLSAEGAVASGQCCFVQDSQILALDAEQSGCISNIDGGDKDTSVCPHRDLRTSSVCCVSSRLV